MYGLCPQAFLYPSSGRSIELQSVLILCKELSIVLSGYNINTIAAAAILEEALTGNFAVYFAV